ncbi:hypothetical protein [Shewanella gaetbuli]|uniref:Bacterial Ig-like domain (Group 2) n=1 Tax=Shewanella gaetbuli TaxID=220752 RepID=A0A9X1ZWP5_9GAMM|nr:hypothetical protein [Shewanella gaetbuli]MCL1143841.1 hypothetical protein [Shewanella gaetbuli]
MRNINLLAIIIVTILTMVGCGGGGSDQPSKPPVVEKEPRPQLKVEDVVVTYIANAIPSIKLTNTKGKITYQILDSSPANVVKLNDAGQIQILRTGLTTIRATDTSEIYQSSQASFTINVEKAENTSLVANELNLAALDTTAHQLVVRGQKGPLTYRVKTGHESLIDINSDGKVTALGAVGEAIVEVTDAGDDNYLPQQINVKVVIHSVEADKLQFAPLEALYREGLTLEPTRLDNVDVESITYKIINSLPDDQVAEIFNPQQGNLTIKNVGQIEVEATATYSDAYDQKQQTATFAVVIKQGKRESLTVDEIVTHYSTDSYIYPTVSHHYGDVEYQVVTGGDVVELVQAGDAFKMKSVGTVVVEASEKSTRNYPASSTQFSIEVTPAPHLGIADTASSLSYKPALSLPLQFAGQKGQLTAVDALPAGLRVEANNLLVDKAGLYKLKFEDDGGELYLPTQFSLTLDVAKAAGENLPALSYGRVYAPNLQINLLKDLGLTHISQLDVIKNSQQDVASLLNDGILQVHKAGKTQLTLRRAENDNYLAGAEQVVYVDITTAANRLKLSSDSVSMTWAANNPLIKGPVVEGDVGTVTYEFLAGAATDVVSLNTQTGEMRIQNTGTTRVKVKDSGNSQYAPGEVSFTVNIEQADNPVSVDYFKTTFSPDAAIIPLFSAPVDAQFRLINQASQTVAMPDINSGLLRIKNAGTYQVEVTYGSRNYKTKTVIVDGVIDKAKHPGLPTLVQTETFSPFKTITLDFGTAIGIRSYELAGANPIGFYDLDKANGTVTLKNYRKNTPISLNVKEDESQNYLAMPEQFVTVTVDFADAADIDANHVITQEQTVIVSTLSAPQYEKLEESEFGLMAYRAVNEPTDSQLQQYGKGKVVYLDVKPVGIDDINQRKAILVHVARFDGCLSDLDTNSPDAVKAIDYDAAGYCTTGRSVRMTRFSVINDSALQDNTAYELVEPLIYYRRGQREFLADDNGGFYTLPDVTYGVTKYGFPKSLYEWGIVQFNYQTTP